MSDMPNELLNSSVNGGGYLSYGQFSVDRF